MMPNPSVEPAPSASRNLQTSAVTSAALEPGHHSHILTQFAGEAVYFPADWVTDIIVVERAKILSLPFYPKSLLGVVHYQTQVVPLVNLEQLASSSSGIHPTQSTLMAVRLSEVTGLLKGVGVVIDRLLGHADEAAIATAYRFQLSDLDPSIWQPVVRS